MVHSIERLGEVKEYSDHEMAPLQGVDNAVHELDDCHFRGMILSKPKLKLV